MSHYTAVSERQVLITFIDVYIKILVSTEARKDLIKLVKY